MTTHPPRRLGLAVAALLVGAPLLWASAAQADPDATVTFSGGCGQGPAGVAFPEPAEITVAPGAELRFVNGLDSHATLSFDGEAAAELPGGGVAGVVFHDGPVTATLAVACPTGALSTSATVEVTGARLPEPSGQPPTSGPPDTVPQESLLPGRGSPADPDNGGETSPDGDSVDESTGDDDDEQLPQTASGGASGPNGMLALVATICAAGVTAGAIRVIVAQRSTRTGWA